MSFLSDYRIYTEGTEAHPTYHTFSALTALSSIVSRRVWVEMGYFNVFSNLYVVLVGPPGNRKTSAMSTAKKLLRELGNVPFSAESVTKEKLVLDIFAEQRFIEDLPDRYEAQRQYAPMTVMVTELSQFLGAASMHMVDFLTTVYDQDFYDSRTKNHGETSIAGPFLNILACTTPDWITFYLKSDVISGGFSRRAIFVYELEKGQKIPFPRISEEAKQAWVRLVAYSQRVQKVAGPFQWDPLAREFFIDWYDGLEIPQDEAVAGYYDSKHIQLIKISMLIALSDSTELILRKEHLEFGLALLGLAEQNLRRVFEGIGRNELNAAATKTQDILGKAPSVSLHYGEAPLVFPHCLPEKELRAMMFRFVRDEEQDAIFKHLINSNKIIRLSAKAAGSKRPRNYVALKTKETPNVASSE